MTTFRHKTWGIIVDADTAENAANKIGADPNDLMVVRVYTEYEYILKDVPIEFHPTLSYMAYERGHSAGQAEIILILQELVNSLLPPIREFELNTLAKK